MMRKPRGWRRGCCLLDKAMEAAGGALYSSNRETLLAARRACKALSRTNCWSAVYDTREYLATQLDILLRYGPTAKRKKAGGPLKEEK